MGKNESGEKIRWSQEDRRFIRRWLGMLALLVLCVLVAVALISASQDAGRI